MTLKMNSWQRHYHNNKHCDIKSDIAMILDKTDDFKFKIEPDGERLLVFSKDDKEVPIIIVARPKWHILLSGILMGLEAVKK